MVQFTLEQARKYAGKTQQEMADELGICRHTWMTIEKNPEQATMQQAEKISEITGIPVTDIIFAQDST